MSKAKRTNFVGGPFDGWGFDYPGDDHAPAHIEASGYVYERTSKFTYMYQPQVSA